MAEEISNPLLSLVKEQGLIDDLQYEEVAAEFKRSGTPVIQLLQDFGIMKLDDILQVMAELSGHGGRVAARRAIYARAVARRFRPMSRACINACRSPLNDGTVQVALADPLDPARADEIHFARQAGRAGRRGRPRRHRKGD